jgi:hypothetical protein
VLCKKTIEGVWHRVVAKANGPACRENRREAWMIFGREASRERFRLKSVSNDRHQDRVLQPQESDCVGRNCSSSERYKPVVTDFCCQSRAEIRRHFDEWLEHVVKVDTTHRNRDRTCGCLAELRGVCVLSRTWFALGASAGAGDAVVVWALA